MEITSKIKMTVKAKTTSKMKHLNLTCTDTEGEMNTQGETNTEGGGYTVGSLNLLIE